MCDSSYHVVTSAPASFVFSSSRLLHQPWISAPAVQKKRSTNLSISAAIRHLKAVFVFPRCIRSRNYYFDP